MFRQTPDPRHRPALQAATQPHPRNEPAVAARRRWKWAQRAANFQVHRSPLLGVVESDPQSVSARCGADAEDSPDPPGCGGWGRVSGVLEEAACRLSSRGAAMAGARMHTEWRQRGDSVIAGNGTLVLVVLRGEERRGV